MNDSQLVLMLKSDDKNVFYNVVVLIKTMVGVCCPSTLFLSRRAHFMFLAYQLQPSPKKVF
jgi:hypothetical protein